MAKPRKISESDEAMLERAIAAGSTAYRDKQGRVILLIEKNAARLSLADRRRLREMSDEADADFVAQGGRIIVQPNPANLVGGERYYAAKTLTAGQLDDAIKITRFANAGRRIAKLKHHAELRDVAERLKREMPKEEAFLDKNLRAVIPGDSFWADLAHAEKLALAYDAAPSVIRDGRRQAGTRKKRGSRMPELDAHIARQLDSNPRATNDELWASVLDERDDFARSGVYRDGDKVVEYHDEREHAIRRRSFDGHVTTAREKRGAVSH